MLTCKILVAQQYSFTYYNASHGLPSSEITAIAKDNKGFLWIGTAAGLSYYDGYTFTNYQYADENHFVGTVNVITPAGADTIWIGAGSGLYCITKNRLTKVNEDANTPQGVNSILVESSGNMWLATENGPAYIPARAIKAALENKINLNQWLLPQWPTSDAAIDKRRATVVAMAPDSSIYIAQNESLFLFIKNKFTPIFTAAEDRDAILSIFPVSRNKVFFDCAVTEMNKVENGQWTYVYKGKPYFKEHQPGGDGFWYAGTQGLFYFNPGDETVSALINTLNKGVYWPSAMVKDGAVFWLATHDGLIKLKPVVFNNYYGARYQNVKEVYSVLKLSNGSLLFGGNRGSLLKKQGDEYVNFLPTSKTLVSNAEVKSLYEDERGWLWAGTGYQGLALYRNKKVTVFNYGKYGLHDNSIHFVFSSGAGKLFALGDQGISEIIVGRDESISFKPYYYEPTISTDAAFYTAIAAPGNTIWAGGQEGLFFLRNNAWHRFNLLNKLVQVNDMKQLPDGSVWIATSGQGILKCIFKNDTALQLIKQYRENEGLNTNLFLNLLVDHRQNIWAASAKGISLIGLGGEQKGSILNFDEADGFLKTGYNNIKLYQENDSTIWAVTTLGITSFNPYKLFLTGNHPVVFITAVNTLKTNNKISISDTVSSSAFSNGNNSFTFSYTAVDYANQESVVYYYRMLGADTNWQYAGSNRSVTFQNLSPGTYTLSVKALNDKGLWSSNTASYRFSIASPFWQKWWFLLCSILLALAIIAALIKRRERIVAKREAEKTAIEKLKAASYQYQLEIEQVINYFATSINQQYTVDDMLWDVARNCISKLGFEDCVIYLLDEDRGKLIQKAAWGPKTTEENKIVDPIEIAPGKGIVGTVAITGKAEIISDTSQDQRYIVDDANRLSEITVPIVSNNKIAGIIDSEHSQKNFYTQRHLQILTTIASLLADKIEKLIASQQAREKEIELLRLNKDLATWQITAIRAQMNPHFIFNAMNSIQQFTLLNDSNNANLYISKFSTLLRKVLYSSQQDNISLEEEIEQLQLYLDIEKLRMGENFWYDITVDEEIETDAIKIPGMLLQPFVENAVKHGLALKEGAKRLNILFAMPDEFHLHAVITDNGIGRKKSAEIKAQQKLMPHISKGIQLVKERLELLQQDKNLQASMHINDLPGGAGTSVTLIIPVS